MPATDVLQREVQGASIEGEDARARRAQAISGAIEVLRELQGEIERG